MDWQDCKQGTRHVSPSPCEVDQGGGTNDNPPLPFLQSAAPLRLGLQTGPHPEDRQADATQLAGC